MTVGIFGRGATHQVRILGPLLVDGKPIICPEKGCGHDGKGGGHVLTAAGEKGAATVTCGANPAHRFAVPALTIAVVKAVPQSGRFELRADGLRLIGIAARPGKGQKTEKPKMPLTRALGAQQKPPAPASGKSSSGGPGLGAVLVAGLGTATAGLNTVSALAGTATAGANVLKTVAQAGNTALTVAGKAVDGRNAAAKARRGTPKRAL